MEQYYLVEYYDAFFKKNHENEYNTLDAALDRARYLYSLPEMRSVRLLEVKQVEFK